MTEEPNTSTKLFSFDGSKKKDLREARQELLERDERGFTGKKPGAVSNYHSPPEQPAWEEDGRASKVPSNALHTHKQGPIPGFPPLIHARN